MDLYIGADIGGTSTKMALFAADGTTVHAVTGKGGNFRTSPDTAFQNIQETLTELVSLTDPAHIISGHFGVAGAGSAGYNLINSSCQKLWGEIFPQKRLTVSSDLEIAYYSTTQQDGLLLLAGTGAVACTFHDWSLTGRSDGMGWILGDAGAGLWIGLEALKAVSATLNHSGPETQLVSKILEHYNIATDNVDPRQALIGQVYAQPPTDYGKIAPLVSTAALNGDNVATDIIERAAQHLVSTLQGAITDAAASGYVLNTNQTTPLVVAGTLLSQDTPLKKRVLELLATTNLKTELLVASAPIQGSFILATK